MFIDRANMDYVLNGSGYGPVAEQLADVRFDTGMLRPFIDTDPNSPYRGRPVVILRGSRHPGLGPWRLSLGREEARFVTILLACRPDGTRNRGGSAPAASWSARLRSAYTFAVPESPTYLLMPSAMGFLLLIVHPPRLAA
jgi:hypothetical protein